MYGDISGALGGDFIPQDHEAATDFEPLPAGDYQVMIDSAEVKPTKKQDGTILKLTMTVVGEQYNGRKLFGNLNLKNPNKQCEDIGIRKLAALGQAVGLTVIRDSAELHGKQLIVKVQVEAGDGNNAPSNDIRAYKPLSGTQPQYAPSSAPQAAQPPHQVPPPPAANNAPPWARK